MNKELLKKYSAQNPEKFNKEFIMSRGDHDILRVVRDIFNSLEILDEITIEEVSLHTDEASFGPIKAQHHYYKSIYPSRINRIHYKVRITPNENVKIEKIELGQLNNNKPATSESFIKEGDLFVNKLIDDCFYINEGVRYFLIYQIVDNSTYGADGSVSLKSLLMPITLKPNSLIITPEFNQPSVELKSFDSLLFSKSLNPLFYILGKDSYNSIVDITSSTTEDDLLEKWTNHRDPSLINKLNEFFRTDFKFAEKALDLVEDERTVFKISESCFVSVKNEELKNNLAKAFLGCLLNLKNEKKKKLAFSYDQLISPWYWIDNLAAHFSKNNDFIKKFIKVKTLLISLNRLMDESCRKVLTIPERDKVNALTVIRYIMENFDELLSADGQDLDSKRLRLYEYQFYPLRKLFSDNIYRILNAPTKSRAVLERTFSSLNPMYIIKQTVTNELLRYYNSTNEINLFSALLKVTFRGPQSLGKTVSLEQRDLHPSYVGRLSLVASSASDPGLSTTLVPFVEMHNYYFKEQK